MREPIYETNDEWRTIVIMNLVHVRRSIHELSFVVAIIAVGAFAAKWWDYAPIVGAAVAWFSAMVAYRTAAKDYDILAKLHFAADKD